MWASNRLPPHYSSYHFNYVYITNHSTPATLTAHDPLNQLDHSQLTVKLGLYINHLASIALTKYDPLNQLDHSRYAIGLQL